MNKFPRHTEKRMHYILCPLHVLLKHIPIYYGIFLLSVLMRAPGCPAPSLPSWCVRSKACSADLEPEAEFASSWEISRTQKHVAGGKGIGFPVFMCHTGAQSLQDPNASLDSDSLHPWGKHGYSSWIPEHFYILYDECEKEDKQYDFKVTFSTSQFVLQDFQQSSIEADSWKQIKHNHQLDFFSY